MSIRSRECALVKKKGLLRNAVYTQHPFYLLPQFLAQHIRVSRIRQGCIPGNDSVAVEPCQTGIHREHIRIRGRVHNTFDLRNLVVTDHVTDGRCNGHELKCRNHRSVYGRD